MTLPFLPIRTASLRRLPRGGALAPALAGLLLVPALLAACGTQGADPDDTDAVDDTDPGTTDDSDTPAEDDTDEPYTGDPCLRNAAIIQIGEGENSFRSVAVGGDIHLVHGEQAGPAFHVPLALQVTNTTQQVRLRITVSDALTGTNLGVNRESLAVNYVMVPPVLGQIWACQGTAPGQNVILDPKGYDEDDTVEVWEEMCGREIEVEVEIKAADNTLIGTATHRMTVQPDPADGPVCD